MYLLKKFSEWTNVSFLNRKWISPRNQLPRWNPFSIKESNTFTWHHIQLSPPALGWFKLFRPNCRFDIHNEIVTHLCLLILNYSEPFCIQYQVCDLGCKNEVTLHCPFKVKMAKQKVLNCQSDKKSCMGKEENCIKPFCSSPRRTIQLHFLGNNHEGSMNLSSQASAKNWKSLEQHIFCLL